MRLSTPWSDAGAGYVVASADVFTPMEKARAHLKVEPKVSPSLLVLLIPHVLMGVNRKKYDNPLKTVSNASALPTV